MITFSFFYFSFILFFTQICSAKYSKTHSSNNIENADDFSGKISKSVNQPDTSVYGEYGVDWVYFPDGDGKLKIGFLRHPKYYNFSARTTIISDPKPEDVVKFIFYNRKNNVKGGTTFTLKNMSKILDDIDNSKPLKFVTHGWLSSGYSDTCQLIKDSYLKKGDFNVVVMDWSTISDTVWYYKPLTKTKDVAFYYSKIVNKFISNGMDSKNIHLIGHSLGAHVSGFTANYLNTTSQVRVKRITGLDPALPGFIYLTDRLSRKDAEFVDVIHTCGGFLGILSQIGHADFYPNGGTPPQPGCSGVDEVVRACSHGMSWILFQKSINSGFEAFKCDSWDDFQLGICIREKTMFGDPVPTSARGSYYFKTDSIKRSIF